MFLLICISGALGAVARFSLSEFIVKRIKEVGIYYWIPSHMVNLLGSFCLGIVVGLYSTSSLSAQVEQILGLGFLGSFTTLSSISFDLWKMLTAKRGELLAFYLLTTIVGCFLVYKLGFHLALL